MKKINTTLVGLSLIAAAGISASAFAATVTINGTIPGEVRIHQTGLTAAPSFKKILFERIVLSEDAKKFLAESIKKPTAMPRLAARRQALPTSLHLGMNDTPVLDQGRHGTCVTFATIAAIDAATSEMHQKKGEDTFSELCSLELGTTLENESPVVGKDSDGKDTHQYPSGWDGTWGTILLPQIEKYGLITMEYQKTNGCSNVFSYPLDAEEDHGNAMTAADYTSHSETIIPPISYNVILKDSDAFTSRAKTEEVLQKVKEAIATNHRLIFGVLLDVKYGDNGAMGTYKTRNDTWILTPEIAEDAAAGKIEAGHEMIITGYDDEAEVEGHKGVLTLRNSWGTDTVNHDGTYYMTYDYFTKLAMEVSEIAPNTLKKHH